MGNKLHKSGKIFPLYFKITPENPVLWTGMKGVSAEGRKKPNQMLKRY